MFIETVSLSSLRKPTARAFGFRAEGLRFMAGVVGVTSLLASPHLFIREAASSSFSSRAAAAAAIAAAAARCCCGRSSDPAAAAAAEATKVTSVQQMGSR